jgi:hypothetical protein
MVTHKGWCRIGGVSSPEGGVRMDEPNEYTDLLEHLLNYCYNRRYSLPVNYIYLTIKEFLERQTGARGET